MNAPLLGLIFDTSRPEWADLLLLPVVVLAYAALSQAWPETFLRPLWWLLTHTVYRLRVHGRANIPATGPVLIVCNHVSYIDWMLIWAACPRPVRFLASSSHFRNPILAAVLRMVRVIPVDDKTGGPRSLLRSLRQAAAVLDAGGVLCVFAEGQLTRTGLMLPFRRGFERIVRYAKQPVPIVPAYLAHVWGSVFSYHRGRLFWKWPRHFPYPVAVQFGKPLPPDTPAAEVRQAVQEAGADCAIAESGRLKPPHREFVRAAARHPFRTCYIDTTTGTERVLSYGKALAAVRCLSRWLRPRLGPEKHVGVWLPSSMGSALVNIAIAFLGKTSVNLNYTAGRTANESAIRQTGLKVVITSKRFAQRMPLELPEGVGRIDLEDALAAITTRQKVLSFLAVVLLPGWVLEHLVYGLGGQGIDEVATVIFSSGSTGEPKGVMLSHRNIAANIESLVTAIELSAKDRLLGVLPFFHSFGYTVTLWGPLQVAASSVYWPDPRQAKEIGELCRTYKVTILLSTATFLRFYLRRCDPEDFRSVRLLACGAEKLPIRLADEFEKKFGFRPVEGYGCTEVSPAVAVAIPDREVNGLRQRGAKPGSVGQPLPGIAVKVTHYETGERLPPGAEGLLWVKGANVMVGYLNQPKKTAEVIKDGWYNTGDMAVIDEDGFITLTGRLSRFAKVGGEMVPLERLEQEMHDILGTTDLVLGVTSLPDEKRGERIVVLYLPAMEMSPAELVKRLRERGLPNLWIPDERDFFPADDIPILGSGKLNAKRVQDMARELVRERDQQA